MERSRSLKKGIVFYEKALTLVDIQDNSAINHIDTITIKPGKEAEIKQLIQDMDGAGLLKQKYKYRLTGNDFSTLNLQKIRQKRATRLFLLYSPSKASFIWSKKPFFFGLTFKSPAAANSFKAAF